ncbi:MAG: carbon storage regulator CsrA [Candidatus Kapaibacteriota bacterium]|jgi:carbon storage regulator
MLVLSRKIGEVITVGSSVKVTVLSYDRGVVRLGIEAPKTIPVHRKEVHDKIVEMNKKAAKTQLQAFKDAINNTSVVFDKSRISKVTKKDLDNSTFIMSDKSNLVVKEEVKQEDGKLIKQKNINKVKSSKYKTKK